MDKVWVYLIAVIVTIGILIGLYFVARYFCHCGICGSEGTPPGNISGSNISGSSFTSSATKPPTRALEDKYPKKFPSVTKAE